MTNANTGEPERSIGSLLIVSSYFRGFKRIHCFGQNSRTEDIAALSKERSVLAGGMWTVLTFLGPLVFKAYQDPIVALIGKLFRH
jgi:hypothetical protein